MISWITHQTAWQLQKCLQMPCSPLKEPCPLVRYLCSVVSGLFLTKFSRRGNAVTASLGIAALPSFFPVYVL